MTTTVGVITKEGVVLATDQRATMGRMIACKTAKKVHKITNTIGMTIAGGVGDAQALIRGMQANCKLFELRAGGQMSVGAASTFLSNNLAGNFFEVQLLLGGVASHGYYELYSIDSAGGATLEGEVTATGSGSPFAYGVLEAGFKEGMTKDEGIALAIEAVKSAKGRDSASGQKTEVIFIGANGFQEIGLVD
jgi:proteasome beta subunit